MSLSSEHALLLQTIVISKSLLSRSQTPATVSTQQPQGQVGFSSRLRRYRLR